MGNGGTDMNNRVRLGGIDWLEAFPFTHLFRTFRLAIHPSKLLLALIAVVVCYLGGWFMDLVAGKRVVVSEPAYTLQLPADEIRQYLAAGSTTEFQRWRGQAIQKNRQELASMLVTYLSEDPAKAEELAGRDQALDQLEGALTNEREKALEILANRHGRTRDILKEEYEQSVKTAKDKSAAAEAYEDRLKELDQSVAFLRLSMWNSTRVASLELKLDPARAAAAVVREDPAKTGAEQARERRDVEEDRKKLLSAVRLADSCERADALQGVGIFRAALSYGILMFNCAVDSVLAAELFFNEAFQAFTPENTAPPGLVRTLALSASGLGWFARAHWVYFIIYTLFCLVVWSVAGGAICRIAALHATRDEKIPLKEAVSFAWGKIGNFFAAPLMPVLFILGCCLFLVVGGLIGAIPAAGEIVVGLLFGVSLAVSFVLALIIVGILGGLGLMYPAIAVEGSDAFDAVSRCYSYVYTRPWRTIFYTLVMAIYGTLCFVFVKLFVGLIFMATWSFVGATMNWDSSGLAAPLGKLEAAWHSPSLAGPFFGTFSLFHLGFFERVGSLLICIWVYLLVGLVIAFAISFFFSGYTLIYLLLRRQVDATELEEVFVEEFETEDLAELRAPEPGAGEAAEEPAKAETPPESPDVAKPTEEPEPGGEEREDSQE